MGATIGCDAEKWQEHSFVSDNAREARTQGMEYDPGS